MKGTARHQLRNRMPSGYFADAPTHFEAPAVASSGGSRAQHTDAPADTHAAASSSSEQLGNCAVGVHGAGGGERSHAAGNQSLVADRVDGVASTGGCTMDADRTECVIEGDAREGVGTTRHNSTAGGVKTSGASSLSARHREIIASLAAQGVAIVDDMQRNAARVIFGRAQG